MQGRGRHYARLSMIFDLITNQVKETAEELGISTRQVSRDKNSALAKMLKRMKAAGYESYAEAAGVFLQESDYIPTQNGNTEFY